MVALTPRYIVASNIQLLSLPEIVLRLNKMINDPKCSAVEIGNEVGKDPALTVRMLKIVNSPFYNFPSQVDNIPMAITILGTRQLRDLVLATSVIKRFNSVPADLVNMDIFWHHSICCALASRSISSFIHINNSERFFVSGLLHDIGKLVMYITLPDQSRAALQRMKNSDDDFKTIEKSIFGFNHSELGSELLRHWNLPDSVIEPIAHHHQPSTPNQYPIETAVIHLADVIANQIQAVISPDDVNPADPAMLHRLNISDKDLEEIQNDVYVKFQETINIIYLNKAA